MKRAADVGPRLLPKTGNRLKNAPPRLSGKLADFTAAWRITPTEKFFAGAKECSSR